MECVSREVEEGVWDKACVVAAGPQAHRHHTFMETLGAD